MTCARTGDGVCWGVRQLVGAARGEWQAVGRGAGRGRGGAEGEAAAEAQLLTLAVTMLELFTSCQPPGASARTTTLSLYVRPASSVPLSVVTAEALRPCQSTHSPPFVRILTL